MEIKVLHVILFVRILISNQINSVVLDGLARIQSSTSSLAYVSVQKKSVCAEFYTGCNTKIWWDKSCSSPTDFPESGACHRNCWMEPDRCVPISPRPNRSPSDSKSVNGEKRVSALWQVHHFYFNLAGSCRHLCIIHVYLLRQCSFVF